MFKISINYIRGVLYTVIRTYKELEIKGIVNTQQGTEQFITNRKITFLKGDKKELLKSRCINFIDELTM